MTVVILIIVLTKINKNQKGIITHHIDNVEVLRRIMETINEANDKHHNSLDYDVWKETKS